jgi:hypothetical protein
MVPAVRPKCSPSSAAVSRRSLMRRMPLGFSSWTAGYLVDRTLGGGAHLDDGLARQGKRLAATRVSPEEANGDRRMCDG